MIYGFKDPNSIQLWCGAPDSGNVCNELFLPNSSITFVRIYFIIIVIQWNLNKNVSTSPNRMPISLFFVLWVPSHPFGGWIIQIQLSVLVGMQQKRQLQQQQQYQSPYIFMKFHKNRSWCRENVLMMNFSCSRRWRRRIPFKWAAHICGSGTSIILARDELVRGQFRSQLMRKLWIMNTSAGQSWELYSFCFSFFESSNGLIAKNPKRNSPKTESWKCAKSCLHVHVLYVHSLGNVLCGTQPPEMESAQRVIPFEN